jgi:hypothetical protein
LPKSPETALSALPPKADIAERDCHVRFVPKAEPAASLDPSMMFVQPLSERKRNSWIAAAIFLSPSTL